MDPRTQGTNLTTDEDIAGVEYIYNVTKSLMKEQCGNIMTELAQIDHMKDFGIRNLFGL